MRTKNNIFFIGILAGIIILLLLIPLIIADDSDNDSNNNGVDDVSEQESELIISSGKGAQIRILQLHKAIELRILWMREVVLRINNSYPDYDTSNLETIIDNLVVIGNDAELAADNSMNLSAQENVEQFINIKRNAKALVKQFRDEVKDLLNDDDKFLLRAAFKKSLSDKNVELLNNDLRKKIFIINSERLESISESLGISNISNLSAEEIRSLLIEKLRGLSKEKVLIITDKLKNDLLILKNDAYSKSLEAHNRLQEKFNQRIINGNSNNQRINIRINNQ